MIMAFVHLSLVFLLFPA